MKIIAIDDEPLALTGFEDTLKELKIHGVEYLKGFFNPIEALEFAKNNHVDLAFLDIEMSGMSGIVLANHLREYNEDIRVVFITGYEEFAMQAFEADAIGYLLKPYRAADLEKQIKKAGLIGTKTILFPNGIFVRTFPKFDLFVNNKVIVFQRSKSKEMLAYLVDKKGSAVTLDEMIAILWEDREYDSRVKALYREAVMQLRKTLDSCGAADMLGIRKGMCYVETSKFECDYYNLLKKNPSAISQYAGEYMADYSWAEATTVLIERILKGN